MPSRPDVLDLAGAMKAKGEAFALATVVRTVALTAAKAGAKAVIRSDGSISEGWIGGGCARAAVLRAAREALADGQARLVSVQPQDVLAEHHVAAGQLVDGVHYVKNACPSRGTMDVFVEPILPKPSAYVCGASPVAVAIAALARRMGFFITVFAPAADHAAFEEVDRFVDGYAFPPDAIAPYVAIATQGRGDSAALKGAFASGARHIAFVGSRKKAEAMRAEFAAAGVAPERLAAMRCPAGLDLGAVTPEEIALSIVAEMVEVRRRGRDDAKKV
jgi:xanthine dehydrogenase accessory factor